MSSIFGYTGGSFDLLKMQTSLMHWKPDRFSDLSVSNFSVGALELYKTPECKLVPQPFKDEDLVVSLDGRIDNRKELSEQLNLKTVGTHADIEFVSAAYKKWGKDCVNHLVGAFVFSVWDEKQQSLFIARDHMGVKPVYYAIVNNELVFSSEMKGILALPEFEKKANEQYIVSAFSSLILSAEQTLYENINQLPPANFLLFKKNELTVEKYWTLGGNKVEIPNTVNEQVKRFGELFKESVEDRLRSAGELGAELSGGLDSTGIAAFAMKVLGKGHPFYSYCYGKSENPTGEHDTKDDVGLVREFCSDYEISEYLTVTNESNLSGKDYIEYYNEILDDLDGNGVPLLATTFLPKAQKQNVNVMFSGWAGDQIVTSTAGGFYEAKANKGMYLSFWKDLREKLSLQGSIARWGFYILKSWFKPFYKQNLKTGRKSVLKGCVKPELIQKYNLMNLPSPRYYLKSCTDIQSYQKVNISHSGIVNRTVNHGLVGKHFNIDYRFPMLDIRLLEYVHALPFSTTAPKGKTRYLFKQLIKDIVPKGVVELHKSFVPTTPFARSFFKDNKDSFIEEYDRADKSKLISVLNLENNIDLQILIKLQQLCRKLN